MLSLISRSSKIIRRSNISIRSIPSKLLFSTYSFLDITGNHVVASKESFGLINNTLEEYLIGNNYPLKDIDNLLEDQTNYFSPSLALLISATEGRKFSNESYDILYNNFLRLEKANKENKLTSREQAYAAAALQVFSGNSLKAAQLLETYLSSSTSSTSQISTSSDITALLCAQKLYLSSGTSASSSSLLFRYPQQPPPVFIGVSQALLGSAFLEEKKLNKAEEAGRIFSNIPLEESVRPLLLLLEVLLSNGKNTEASSLCRDFALKFKRPGDNQKILIKEIYSYIMKNNCTMANFRLLTIMKSPAFCFTLDDLLEITFALWYLSLNTMKQHVFVYDFLCNMIDHELEKSRENSMKKAMIKNMLLGIYSLSFSTENHSYFLTSRLENMKDEHYSNLEKKENKKSSFTSSFFSSSSSSSSSSFFDNILGISSIKSTGIDEESYELAKLVKEKGEDNYLNEQKVINQKIEEIFKKYQDQDFFNKKSSYQTIEEQEKNKIKIENNIDEIPSDFSFGNENSYNTSQITPSYFSLDTVNSSFPSLLSLNVNRKFFPSNLDSSLIPQGDKNLFEISLAFLYYSQNNFEKSLEILLKLASSRYANLNIPSFYIQILDYTILEAFIRNQDYKEAKIFCLELISKYQNGNLWKKMSLICHELNDLDMARKADYNAWQLGVGQGGFGGNI